MIIFSLPSLKRGRDGVLIPLDPTDHTTTAKIGLSRTGGGWLPVRVSGIAHSETGTEFFFGFGTFHLFKTVYC